MLPLTLTVNGERRQLLAEPRTQLADLLREQLNLTGTHLGCEQGVCGACTVLIDGVPQRSCISYAVDCDGAEITTIEGFDADPTMEKLRENFSAHHALQCGFCTPGMLVSARDIVLRLGEVPEARVREELSGNICRCTGYVGIVGAVCATAKGCAPQESAAPLAAAALAAPTVAAAVQTTAPRAAQPLKGGNSLTETIAIAIPPDQVWEAMGDLPALAACLPGAEITEVDGEAIKGRMKVALGPIKVAFAGTGTVQLDAATRSGVLRGAGRDGGTGSSAEGELRFALAPSATGTDVAITLQWRLTGALAQFGRSGLVADLVRRLAQQFAANLQARLAGAEPPAQPAPLNLFQLLWAALKARFGR